MPSISVFRVATRAVRPSGLFRASQLPRTRVQAPAALAIGRPAFSTSMKLRSGQHDDETYEEFSARYAITIREPIGPGRTRPKFEKEFDGVQDVFELQ
ncbi:hypothetical protein AOCH_007304, partial [Aspergillus ochraceoroseus]